MGDGCQCGGSVFILFGYRYIFKLSLGRSYFIFLILMVVVYVIWCYQRGGLRGRAVLRCLSAPAVDPQPLKAPSRRRDGSPLSLHLHHHWGVVVVSVR